MRLAVLGLACWLVASWSLVAQDDGSGPAISVPKDSPDDTAHALPKPNWIDQSQADADKKAAKAQAAAAAKLLKAQAAEAHKENDDLKTAE